MELASKDGLSLNHFISMAVAEKIVRLESMQARHLQHPSHHHHS